MAGGFTKKRKPLGPIIYKEDRSNSETDVALEALSELVSI